MQYPPYFTTLKPLRALFAGARPVITYHNVGPAPARTRIRGMYLPVKLLRRQLAELRDAGFAAAALDEYLADTNDGRDKIALTFDDGFQKAFYAASSLLDEFGFRATQFLVADRVGEYNIWDAAGGEVREQLMTKDDVRQWLKAGHAVGSHTLTHAHLCQIPPAQMRAEIYDSKKKLEDMFAVEVKHFCYPYGEYDARVLNMVRQAGYVTACSVDYGVNSLTSDPYRLKRIPARYRSWSLKRLWGG